MKKAIRLLCGPICFLALLMSHPAQAELTTINCNTAVHIQDFRTCALNYAMVHYPVEGLSWYVVFNAVNLAPVKVTAIYMPRSNHLVYTAAAYKPNGTAALTDADLGVTDASLILTISKAGGIPNLNIDPNQVYSLLNVEFPEVLTRQINGDLLSLLGPLYTEVTPVGTVVSVTCTGDGTNAQFIRISLTGTVMWEMVPGTLKNKAGQFIDSSGKVIAPPVNHLTSSGWLSALPNFPGSGLAPGDWLYWSDLPGGTVTVGLPCSTDNPC